MKVKLLRTGLIALASERPWPRPQCIGADPAGDHCTEHASKSLIAMWKERGWPMVFRSSNIEPGLAAVRRLLRSADGRTRLTIHPRCAQLVRSLATYRYPARAAIEDVNPMKDGADHACDALRYLVVNLESPFTVHQRGY